MMVVCPWHRVEYDIETGMCLAFKEFQLRKFKVVIDGENVLVHLRHFACYRSEVTYIFLEKNGQD
ncbi:MAG: Rieske (2Fe-2S) protein [Nitrososphaerales archaeon]